MRALVAAISDAAAGRPGTVRRKKEKVAAPRKKSSLMPSPSTKHRDNAVYVSWTLDSGRVLRMVAMDSGRYLAIATGWETPRFICSLDLLQTPRTQWRTIL